MLKFVSKFFLFFLFSIPVFSQTVENRQVAVSPKFYQEIFDFSINDSLPLRKSEQTYQIRAAANPTGIDTKIYGYWDLQSNGGAINYIEINPNDPNNIHVTSMISTDSSSATAISMSRRVAYNFSYDGGQSWGTPAVVPIIRSGYPSLILASDSELNYFAAITSHGSPGTSLPLQSALYLDGYEGGKNFSTYLSPLHQPNSDDVLWPSIAQTTNGNIVLAGSFPSSSLLSGLSVIIFNQDRTWNNWTRLETSAKHSGRVAIASGDNGSVAVIWRSSTNPDSLLTRLSSDNGVTWGTKIAIDAENGSAGPCWTGFDAMYIGTTLYVTYTRSNYVNNDYMLANQVRLWKSNTLTSTAVIDSFVFPRLMKTTGVQNIQTNHNFAFNFSSIGKNSSGSRIYIAADAFLQGITDLDGFNYSDIILTYSDDDGTTWTIPKNITNTNDIDERYVSLSTINPIINTEGNDSNWVFMVFHEDRIPGANYATLATEARPVSGTKLKFFKLNVDYKSTETLSINISNKWNMVSVPVDISTEKNVLFPTSVTNAFIYTPGIGYTVENILKPGKGYWLKFDRDQTVVFTANPLNSLLLPVSPGWNMIGSISKPILVSKIVTNPASITTSKYFGYSNGYFIADTLKPGKGYWIKVNQQGTINLIAD
ncbi:MAG: sialidase family protein [Bacteroidota bacterium]|nr:sialidase family protein [Bacteroidota bacterium]